MVVLAVFQCLLYATVLVTWFLCTLPLTVSVTLREGFPSFTYEETMDQGGGVTCSRTYLVSQTNLDLNWCSYSSEETCMGFGIFESEVILTSPGIEWSEEYYSWPWSFGISACVPEICSWEAERSWEEGCISAPEDAENRHSLHLDNRLGPALLPHPSCSYLHLSLSPLHFAAPMYDCILPN